MYKNELLRKGEIALMGDKLVEIAKLEYKYVPVMVKKGFIFHWSLLAKKTIDIPVASPHFAGKELESFKYDRQKLNTWK